MSCTADKLLDLARQEIGVKESPKGSDNVKYNTAYYGRAVGGGGHAWCCAFLWWLFREAGASELFYGGGKTAYCPTLLAYHRHQGQGVAAGDWRPGDVIFFNFSGKPGAAHVGLCEAWDGKRITTIDGNTGSGNEANGGAVMRRTRDKKYIVGAYRPRYAEGATPHQSAASPLTASPQGEALKGGDQDVTQEQFDKMMEDYLARRAKREKSAWSRMDEAKKLGLSDGTRPQDFATREEVATMIVNAAGRK